MTRTSSPQSSVYANFQLLSCTARSVTAASGGLLHHLLTLTTSCTKHGARGCFLLHSTDLTAPFPLGSKMLCVAQTFLLPTERQQATSCPSAFFLKAGSRTCLTTNVQYESITQNQGHFFDSHCKVKYFTRSSGLNIREKV